ncbi:MAG: Uncharacterized protein Greene041619_1017 [Candidatus Peregrinibacteria bacterium Greene0416_19]|nr:MAG: Uncharacterized protein Greene041619_1017 [Candidatus Peregrinibacteria bacterium Greene0416_19]
MSPQHLSVLIRHEEESWSAFARRMRDAEGEIIVILSQADALFLSDPEERATFLGACARQRFRLTIATKDPLLRAAARAARLRVYDRTRSLRIRLKNHPDAAGALRLFSPQQWRQQWRTRLQSMGLLALPRLRIWLLIGLSLFLFLFVVFRLLPSAEIRVWPRKDTISQTANVYLTQSGVTLPQGGRIHALPLMPFRVQIHRTVTTTQISRQFTGTNAEATMLIVNRTPEEVSLRKGTRLFNQAGMVFRTRTDVVVPASGSAPVRARADPQDLYGKDIGDRGNVQAGLRWEIPGLPADTRRLIDAENRTPGTGGRTSSRTLLLRSDIDRAVENQLKPALLVEARDRIDELRRERNARSRDEQWELLERKGIVQETYSGFVLPLDFLGQPVESVPVEGGLTYTLYAYNAQAIVKILGQERLAHVVEGKRLLTETLSPERLKVYVIDYDDDLRWIKLTADLAATEQFVLDPLTPTGARFGQKVRSLIADTPTQDALRIVRNLPEVDRVEISVWPPWSRRIPAIPSHISIVPQ